MMWLNPPRALKAVAGQVLLQGTDVLKQPAHGLRRLRGEKMAMIFQEPMTALNPVMKVGEQIGEVLQIHSDLGLGKRRARVLETMRDEIGRAHVWTPVTNEHLVRRLLLEKKNILLTHKLYN